MANEETNHLAVLLDDRLGYTKNERRRGRKSKKMNEKEIFYEFQEEIENEKSLQKQKKMYENFQYLSFNEKKR